MTATAATSMGLEGRGRVDRRGTGRRRVLKGARLTFNGGYALFECVVRNLSERGAQLSFGDTSGVPSRFELCITGEDGRRNAIVRWRSMTALGVSFE